MPPDPGYVPGAAVTPMVTLDMIVRSLCLVMVLFATAPLQFAAPPQRNGTSPPIIGTHVVETHTLTRSPVAAMPPWSVPLNAAPGRQVQLLMVFVTFGPLSYVMMMFASVKGAKKPTFLAALRIPAQSL
jgi:hypothetical protein